MPFSPRNLLVVLSLLAASAASALNVTLTPEVRLSAPVATAAPFDQRLVGLASNGAQYLAIWFDRRGTVPSLSSGSTTAPLYAGRLDANGRAAKPFGTKILDSAIAASLIGTPSGYLLFWSDTTEGVNFMRLDDNGSPVTAPKRFTDGYLTSAATNGNTILIVHGPFSQNQTATLFTLDGTVISNTPLNSPGPVVTLVLDDRYGLIYQNAVCNGVSPCTYEQVLTTVTVSLSTTTRIRQSASNFTNTAAVVGGDRILVAWVTDSVNAPQRTVSFQVFNFNADPITQEKVIDVANSIPVINGGIKPSAGWDGHEFLVAYPWLTGDGTSGELRTVRITSGGFIIDAPPQVLAISLTRPPLFAQASSGILIGWDTFLDAPADIAMRGAPSFDTLATGLTNIIPQSAALQSQVQIAAIGSNTLAVWREGDPKGSIVASSPTTSPVVITQTINTDSQSPGIAASADTYLIAWREQSSALPNSQLRILAKRVRANGTVIENDPILVATDAVPFFTTAANTVAVGSDGKDFLVAWIGAQDSVHAVRVSAAGVALDSTPINLTAQGTPGSLRIVYSNGAYVVAWAADPSCKVCAAPPGPPTAIIYTARVSSAGAVVAAPKQVWIGGAVLRIGLASNGNTLLLAWGVSSDALQSNVCVNALPLTTAGLPDGAVQSIDCAGGSNQYPDIDVAWDGASFVVAWTELDAGRPVAKAERVASSGTPRENAPFNISPTSDPSFGAALASLPDGVAIAYERIANEDEYGGVSRGFQRKLLRAEVAGRRRAVK